MNFKLKFSALLFALLCLISAIEPAQAARQLGDVTCGTTSSTGNGNLTVNAASGQYLPFTTQITNGSTVPYGITASDGKVETGVATWTTAGTVLNRSSATSVVSTDGVGTKLTLPAGTHVVCVNLISAWLQPNLGITDTPQFGGWLTGSDTALATFPVPTGTTVITPITQILGTTEAASAIGIARFENAANGTNISMAKSRGATIGSYTVIQTNDVMGSINFSGSDGSKFVRGATIQAISSATPGADDMPTALVIGTTADGASSPTGRLTVMHDGGVIIGNGLTSPGAENLSIEGGSIEFGNAGTAGTDTTLARSAAGALTLEGNAVKTAGKQTIPLLAGAGTIGTGAVAACTPASAFDSGSNDIFMRQCSFSASAINAIYFTIPMPKNADPSVDLTAEIGWTSTTGTDGSDVVVWGMACVAMGDTDSINANAFPAVDTVNDTQTAAGAYLVTGSITAITPAGTWAVGDLLVCKVQRDGASGTDTFNGTAELIDVRLHYTENAANDN